jgi:glucose/arabinose dehydrogenase
MKKFATTMLLASLLGTAAYAQPNMGEQKPEASLPFNMTKAVTFDSQIWRMAFLPDGRILANEKAGHIWLVTQAGQKTPVSGAPTVLFGGQGGLLGIFLSPHYATDHYVYLTYSEPHEEGAAPAAAPAGGRAPARCPTDASKVCGSSLAMARAKLTIGNGTASLDGLQVLWRDPAGGQGGQFGAAIAFAPDGNSLFLSSGDRQRMAPAQDPNSPLGKILHLTLDGKPAPGNPGAGKPSAQTLKIINPPADTEAAKTAPVVRTFTYPASAPNQTVAETWSMGHRTPYGMAFAPNGQLWEVEHGPRGGDKLNLIQPGKDYGWPLAGYAPNYNGVPVPSFDNQPNLTKPVIEWTPVIAPGSMAFYKGTMFTGWAGSALISGMATKAMVRVTFDGKGGATVAQRWAFDFGIRDVEVAPDGAIWISEGGSNNTNPGALYRLTPK